MSNSGYCVNLEDVIEASNRIKNIAHLTPILTSTRLDRQSGKSLFFKCEAFQRTGSFKFRGALNAILSRLESNTNPSLEVVTHSSGNHAAAVALASRIAGSIHGVEVRATIVMPRNAPSVKKTAVEGYGADIVEVASTNEAREEEAERLVRDQGSFFVHPSENPRVIAGQGTVGLEMTEQIPGMDAVIIPVGGGGLASGNIVSLRALLGEKLRIVLAEPEELDDAKRSKEAGELLSHRQGNRLQSVADGLKTTLGPNTWPIVRDLADEVITVSEQDILRATKLIWDTLKVCIEPSAGVGVAVAMGEEFQRKYPEVQNVGIVLCGGNVDVVKIAALMADIC